MKSKAILRYTRISPQKARLVADIIRNKNVDEAVNKLKFFPKKGALIIGKLLHSAIANAEQNPTVTDLNKLYISQIYVNSGPTWKRFRPRAMGRAARIRKRTSHITIILDEQT